MTDYYFRLSRAIGSLPNSTHAVRDAIYEAARKALVNSLQAAQPPAAPIVIETEQTEFMEAVARIEAELEDKSPDLLSLAQDPPPAPRPSKAPAPPPRAALVSAARPAPARPAAPLEKESSMSRLDEMNKVLKKLQSDSPGVEASALISEDGLMIASALTPDLDDTRVAGMTATLLNLGTRAAVELSRGGVKEVIIRGDNGYAVMIDAGRGVMLLVLANESSKLGLIFFDMREAIRNLKKVF